MSSLEWVFVVTGTALYMACVGLIRSALRGDRTAHLDQARLGGLLAVFVHALTIVLYVTRTGGFSVGLSFLFLSAAVTLLGLALDWLRKLPILVVGTLPLALATSILAIALTFRADPGPAAAAAEIAGIWIAVHVLVALASYSAFALAFVTGILYLVAQRQLKERSAASLLGVMPALETVGRLNIRSIAAGVVLLAAGLVIGYAQARSVFGVIPDWRHDPKIYLTTLTLLAYGVVLALNARPAFRGRRAALASVLSFSLVLVTFWASVFWSGFHRFH